MGLFYKATAVIVMAMKNVTVIREDREKVREQMEGERKVGETKGGDRRLGRVTRARKKGE